MTDKLFEGIEWKDMGLSYEAALHGVQSAMAFRIGRGGWDGANPKHLRTGMSSAMVNCAALAQLLMKKGVFTEEEYLEEMRLAMNNELWREEQDLKPFTFR
jgi:hypothetical protein